MLALTAFFVARNGGGKAMSNSGRTHHLFVFILTVVVSTSIASASILTVTQTGTGAGTLNGVAFPVSNFTITSVMDTANRQPVHTGLGWFIDNTSASIQLNGLGTFAFLTATRIFVSYDLALVGFSRSGSTGADLFNGPSNAAFSTWNMLTPIGPFNGTGQLVQWASQASPPIPQVNTNGGILIFNNGSSATTFKAVVPEPATALLLLAAFPLLRCRRITSSYLAANR